MTIDRRIAILNTTYGSFYCFENDLITEQLVKYGAHTRNELAMVLSFIRQGDSVLDIGAHIGTFSIPMAFKMGPSGYVGAFEANPEAFSVLERNIQLNKCDRIIEAFEAIVTDTPGNYHLEAPESNTGGAFLSLSGDEETQRVPCVLLDRWFGESTRIKEVNLIKIDVEGMEVNVLQSCKELIGKFTPLLYLEISKQHLSRYGYSICDIESFLRGFGYHFFRNIGERNSNSETFTMARISDLARAGEFYDVLAIHPASDRYPESYRECMSPTV